MFVALLLPPWVTPQTFTTIFWKFGYHVCYFTQLLWNQDAFKTMEFPASHVELPYYIIFKIIIMNVMNYKLTRFFLLFLEGGEMIKGHLMSRSIM